MSKKFDKFSMDEIHSGYVVRFRNGTYAMCMRVGQFTKAFVYDNGWVYASAYTNNRCYSYVNGKRVHKDHLDIVEVFGLVEDSRCYQFAKNITDIGRKRLWTARPAKQMTLSEICDALGCDVELIEESVARRGVDCHRCTWDVRSGGKCCGDCVLTKCEMFCEGGCKCREIKMGEPCPYFEEVSK